MREQVRTQGRAWRLALVATLIMRGGVGLLLALTWVFAKPYLPPQLVNKNTIYDGLPVPLHFPGDALLTVWVRWDAVHYLNLAARGYRQTAMVESVFYPLYPLLTRVVAFIFGGRYVLGALVLSTLATLAVMVLLYQLAATYYDNRAAHWAVVALATYPTALFFLAPFSESLFLALTLGAFWAAASKRWVLAGGLGFAASLTRGQGILTAPALMTLAWRQWQVERARADWRARLVAFGSAAMPLVGGGLFLLWRARAGYPPIAQILQEYSGLVMTNPYSGLRAALSQWWRVHDLQTTLDVVSALVFLGMSIAITRTFYRTRPEWVVYTWANLALFMSKESFVASSWQSMARYVVTLFPVFIFWGHKLATMKERRRSLYVTLSSALLLTFSACYALWIFVG